MLLLSLLFQAIADGDAHYHKYCESSSRVSNIVQYTRLLSPRRRLPCLRFFSSGLTRAIMNKPLPTLPRQYDLVESFDALTLAGKKPIEKKLPDPPGAVWQPGRESTFVGGFNPGLLVLSAALDSYRPPPLVPPPTANRNARTAAPPPEVKVSPASPLEQIPIPIPFPVPQVGKQSLTMQYALKSVGPDTPTKPALPPPFVTVPPRPRSNPIAPPKATPKPPLSGVTVPSRPTLDVTSSRPRSVSVPASPATSSGKNTTQCSGMTKAGKQCSRQVKLSAMHGKLDPTPVLYCHQHKGMITAQAGFYVRGVGNADRYVEFSRMRTLKVKEGDGRLISFRRLYT